MKMSNETLRPYGEVVAINVDLQKDFCEGGSLAVAGGAEAAANATAINRWTAENGGMVVATGDWHPRDTEHFEENGGPWPTHCVEYTAGAAFHENLVLPPYAAVAYKGQSRVDDGYSGAEALLQPGSVMSDLVHDLPAEQQTVEQSLERVIKVNAELGKRTLGLLFGVAGDWCVAATGEGLKHLIGPDFDLAIIPEATASIDQTLADEKQRLLEEAGMYALSIEDLRTNITIDRKRLEQ